MAFYETTFIVFYTTKYVSETHSDVGANARATGERLPRAADVLSRAAQKTLQEFVPSRRALGLFGEAMPSRRNASSARSADGRLCGG